MQKPYSWVDVNAGDPAEKNNFMEFRLLYEGPLAANGTAADKQSIRRKLHPQLRELWAVDPHLSGWSVGGRHKSQELAHTYAIGDWNFVPLIARDLGTACSLNILFLRRDNPGGLVVSHGDLDNRLKTLLDALRTPTNRNECAHEIPGAEEKPLYTLLEDDALIVDLSIETDRLLRPSNLTGKAAEANVELVIKVKTKIVDYYKGYAYMHFQ